MSFFVTRPLWPVPGTDATSTPCSAAIRATTGETKDLPFSLASPAATGIGAGEGPAVGGEGAATGAGVSALDGASAAAAASAVAGSGCGSGSAGEGSAPSGAISASFVPTSTVSPSWTKIFATTPVPGLGTSVSTLSVEISSSAWSASIVSPSLRSHLTIVPSETETPICGITTSIIVPVAISRRRVRAARRRPSRPAG
jgi:hypothetical protein